MQSNLSLIPNEIVSSVPQMHSIHSDEGYVGVISGVRSSVDALHFGIGTSGMSDGEIQSLAASEAIIQTPNSLQMSCFSEGSDF